MVLAFEKLLLLCDENQIPTSLPFNSLLLTSLTGSNIKRLDLCDKCYDPALSVAKYIPYKIWSYCSINI